MPAKSFVESNLILRRQGDLFPEQQQPVFQQTGSKDFDLPGREFGGKIDTATLSKRLCIFALRDRREGNRHPVDRGIERQIGMAN